MSLSDLIDRVQRLAELIGPNVYLQALSIAIVFIALGKIADWILSRALGRIASRSKTDIDDRLVDLVHRPIFLSFVLLGLGLATQRLALPEAPEFLTLGILTGSIWLKTVQGGYVDWQDGRQTASLLIWFLYAGLLHGRLIAGWRGRRVAWMNVIGFLVILVTFLQLSHFLE